MLNYFSALSSCFLQKQLLCLLSVPSPTCAGPQQMHTHSHPQLAAVSQGKDSWQPNHTNWRQNHLSTRAHPAPQAPPESQDRRLQQLSRIHMESPSKETTQGLLTHTSSAEGLWETEITVCLLSRITVLRTRQYIFFNLKLFKIPYFTSNNMENTKGWMFQIHVLVSACRYLNYPVT